MFDVLDDQGNEKYQVRTPWKLPWRLVWRLSVFEKSDNEPWLTVRAKPGLTFGEDIIQDKNRTVIAEIIPKFTLRYAACWKISNVQSGCEMATFCKKWSFLRASADIFIHGECLGTFCAHSGGWCAQYMMDLSGDPGGRIDRRIALAFASYLCYDDCGR